MNPEVGPGLVVTLEGGLLIAPRRHVTSYSELSPAERRALWDAIDASPFGREQRFDIITRGVEDSGTHFAVRIVRHPPLPGVYTHKPDPHRDGVGEGPAEYAPSLAFTPLRTDSSAFNQLPVLRFGEAEEQALLPAIRRGFAEADRIDILAAFIQTSGIDLLMGDIADAIVRNTQIRVLTGDYQNITSAEALYRLLSLQQRYRSNFRAFVYETSNGEAFHPKSYVFHKGTQGTAYVGSSNLSRSALTTGIEWNLRLSHGDSRTFRSVAAQFEKLVDRAQPLTYGWVDAYAKRPRRAWVETDVEVAAPEPNELQEEALTALQTARIEGKNAGLVVFATGLGKTYLAAFDCKSLEAKRTLFLAHRQEILHQAMSSWLRVFPTKRTGLLTGEDLDLEVEILFASVQSLSRREQYSRFPSDHFDYIVVDEFHHATAATYRRLLSHFQPRFLLGLTATPDRTDGADLLELCGGNLIIERSVPEGIRKGLLVPFKYFGIKDGVDFENIPWRSGRFDPVELSKRVETSQRAEQAHREYLEKTTGLPGRRTLAFCCSTTHADFMASYFKEKGVHAVAVHSEASSAGRAQSLRAMREGKLEVICAVDLFNEGLDMPDINVVLMLRPTSSPVVYLQQIGRGLRRAKGKDAVTLIDFIGNHRSFLQVPGILASLAGVEVGGATGAMQRLARIQEGLPPGCSVEISTEAIEMLQAFMPRKKASLAEAYRTLRDLLGHRPTIRQFFKHLGAAEFQKLQSGVSAWQEFLQLALGDDESVEDELRVLRAHEGWFKELWLTPMTKCYKMVAIQAMIDADRIDSEISVEELAMRSKAIIDASPELSTDTYESEARRGSSNSFVAAWRKMPLEVLGRKSDKKTPYFELSGQTFKSRLAIEKADLELFESMSTELIQVRIAQYCARRAPRPT